MQKLKMEFKFLNTPKFSYEYENEVNVLGRKLVHIGEGIYIFERPFVSDELSFEQFTEMLKDYKDIAFIRFYECSYSSGNEGKWIVPFALSATHRRHSFGVYRGLSADEVVEYIARFSISDSMKRIINHIAENYLEPDKEFDAIIFEVIYCNQNEYSDDFFSGGRPVDSECTHLLDFKYDTEDERYVLVNGFVGRKILDGIYYFDDAILSVGGKEASVWGAASDFKIKAKRLCSEALQPGDFDENIAFIGEQMWGSGGVYIPYLGCSIYYMAFGDNAIDVLCRLYKNLSGYEMKVMKKDAASERNEHLTVDEVEAILTDIDRREGRRQPVKRKIPEGACELIEGMGFHNLDVRCKLLFQEINKSDDTNSRGFFRYDVTYIMDEKIYLINCLGEKEERHTLSLRMVKELSVRYKDRLFDDVEEDIVQVIIDNGNAEERILGKEGYNDYLKFVTKRW
ncbi:MAG: hypothetical protein J1E01_05165 [Acetatifactor sp.]|nr:hypothetical protein [Acetatifactor sp.]